MGKGGFKGLKVWHKGKDFTVFIYRITEEGNFTEDYGLRDQIRRAAVSIASNVAEGDGREINKEVVRYFYIAKCSSAEVLTQAIIAFEIGYINKITFKEIEKRCMEISNMLSRSDSHPFKKTFTISLTPYFPFIRSLIRQRRIIDVWNSFIYWE